MTVIDNNGMLIQEMAYSPGDGEIDLQRQFNLLVKIAETSGLTLCLSEKANEEVKPTEKQKSYWKIGSKNIDWTRPRHAHNGTAVFGFIQKKEDTPYPFLRIVFYDTGEMFTEVVDESNRVIEKDACSYWMEVPEEIFMKIDSWENAA